jgi:hypothetical protein
MGAHLRVQIPLRAGHSEQSEAQLREGERAWSINREPMNKNRIEGAAKQGERAKNRKALVTKARWRRCGGCVVKVCDPYLGRSRSMGESPTALPEREVSTGRSSCKPGPLRLQGKREGPNESK